MTDTPLVLSKTELLTFFKKIFLKNIDKKEKMQNTLLKKKKTYRKCF